MKVLIVDDHAIVRKGLAQILEEASEIADVMEADSGAMALQKLEEHPFDVVVLDLNMPDMSGFQVLEQMQSRFPDIPVLVLSMHAEDQYGVRVLKAGASGYIAKGNAPSDMLEAIRRVASGGKFISPGLAEHLLTAINRPDDGPLHSTLSDREFQVLRMIANGLTPTEIGDQLALSVKTISTYRSRVLEKLGLRTTADMVQYALKNDLIEE